MITIDPKRKLWREVLSYTLLVIGSALFAVGDVMFVNPYLMAPGGTYGLSNVLNTVWPWKISLYAICMDVPLLIIGTLILGPKFGIKTIISTILIFAFTFILETTWGYNPVIHDGDIVGTQGASMVQIPHGGGWFVPDYFLNTVLAGLIYGVAIGLIFRAGATSGGSDIISMILHKYTKISLGTLVMIVDGIITLSTLIAFGLLDHCYLYRGQGDRPCSRWHEELQDDVYHHRQSRPHTRLHHQRDQARWHLHLGQWTV